MSFKRVVYGQNEGGACNCTADKCPLPGDVVIGETPRCFFHANSRDNELAISKVIINHFALVSSWSQIRSLSAVDLLYAEARFRANPVLPKQGGVSAYEYAEEIEKFLRDEIKREGNRYGQSKS